MSQNMVSRKEGVDMIKSIVVLCLLILSNVQESQLVPPTTLSTSWITTNSELRMPGVNHPTGMLLGFH